MQQLLELLPSLTFTFMRRSSHIIRMDTGGLPIACVRSFVTISLQSDAFVHVVEEMEPRSANTLKVHPGSSRHGYSDRIQHTLMTRSFQRPDREAVEALASLVSAFQ